MSTGHKHYPKAIRTRIAIDAFTALDSIADVEVDAPHTNGPHTACWEGVKGMQDGMLLSLYGVGDSIDEAIVDLFERARGFDRLLRKRASDGARLEYVWTGLAWRVAEDVT